MKYALEIHLRNRIQPINIWFKTLDERRCAFEELINLKEKPQSGSFEWFNFAIIKNSEPRIGEELRHIIRRSDIVMINLYNETDILNEHRNSDKA